MTPRYPENNNIDKYKVFIPKASGSGQFGETLSAPVIAIPGVSSTPTFISIGKFDTLEEAENAVIYVKTKFVRALLVFLKSPRILCLQNGDMFQHKILARSLILIGKNLFMRWMNNYIENMS